MKFEKHLEIDATDIKAVDVLVERTGLTKKTIKQTMTKGAVWLTRKKDTRRVRRADKVLTPGDRLHIYYDEAVLKKKPKNAVLISDQGLYSIWYKPYGMLSQGSKWGDHFTINRWVENNLLPQRSAFIVHRLDRAATGLIIIAHQKKTASYFSNLFEHRLVDKQYKAIVHGKFPEYKKLDSDIGDRSALSHVKSLKYDATINQSLVEVSIETGRKHQIRRHLSEAGFPIVGDRLYGDVHDKGDKDLCLTSSYLSFISPVDKKNHMYALPEALLPGLE